MPQARQKYRKIALKNAADCRHNSGQGGDKENMQEQEAYTADVRQKSDYRDGNKAAPNNNIFFEERSNPLSSKGN